VSLQSTLYPREPRLWPSFLLPKQWMRAGVSQRSRKTTNQTGDYNLHSVFKDSYLQEREWLYTIFVLTSLRGAHPTNMTMLATCEDDLMYLELGQLVLHYICPTNFIKFIFGLVKWL
jgi:hypothetical protein